MSHSSDDVKALLRANIAAIESGERSSLPGARQATSSERKARPVSCESVSVGRDKEGPDDSPERAFRKIERLACAREQASEALRRRLVREGFCEDAVEEAVARAQACGLVDDLRYADVLVRSRLSQGKGRRGIVAELEDLGIAVDEVASLSEGQGVGDDASEISRAIALLERKPPRSKNAREAAYRKLVQKGYGSSVASSAARQWHESLCSAQFDRIG
ncbi:regulatory protein RecX [Paraeggerthella sp. LCP19S3_G8]|uniref:regulatory protein RecX n=1 Tax=Paraeggerthella sp. LCP19S3_G8 TaxID=3440248 RepID=UPI003F99E5D6